MEQHGFGVRSAAERSLNIKHVAKKQLSNLKERCKHAGKTGKKSALKGLWSHGNWPQVYSKV